MKKIHSRIAGALVLVAAASAVLVQVNKQHGTTMGGLFGPESRQLRYQFDWKRGATYTYSLAWKAHNRVNMPELGGKAAGADGAGEGLGGEVDFEGDLVFESYGKRGDVYLFNVRLDPNVRHDLRMMGRDVLASDTTAKDIFGGRAAVAALDAGGGLRGVYFKAGDPPIFKHVMQTILTEAQMNVLANGVDKWDADEVTSLGHDRARYEVEETDPPRVVRTRAGYIDLAALPGRAFGPGEQMAHGETTILLDSGGFLTSLDANEEVTVRPVGRMNDEDFSSKSRFTLTLRAVGAWDPGEDVNLALLEGRRPGEVTASEGASRQILEQRIGGLTLEAMKHGLEGFALTGSFSSPDWLLRASGLLKLHPEYCMDLVATFEEGTMTGRGRAQILDLLAGTGTEAAQAAMRAALESPPARSDASYGQLLQRFSVVTRPAPESVQFVNAAYTNARSRDERMSAAYALGATSGNARNGGNVEAARRTSRELTRAIDDAKSPQDRKDYVQALGNVGLTENVKTLEKLTHDDDDQVRAAAAWALRTTDTQEARETLITLASDGSPDVATRAIESLAYTHVDEGEMRALSRTMTEPGVAPGTDGALLAFLTAHPDAGEPAERMLRAMLDRNDADKAMQARIRHVLEAQR